MTREEFWLKEVDKEFLVKDSWTEIEKYSITKEQAIKLIERMLRHHTREERRVALVEADKRFTIKVRSNKRADYQRWFLDHRRLVKYLKEVVLPLMTYK